MLYPWRRASGSCNCNLCWIARGATATARQTCRRLTSCVTLPMMNCLAVMGKSQIPILHKNLKSFILKSQIPWPKSKSKPQIPISKLKIPIKSQILHKHINMNNWEQRRELAICQCHCYSIACLKCSCDCHSRSSSSHSRSLNSCRIDAVPACTHQTAWYTEQSLNTGWCGRNEELRGKDFQRWKPFNSTGERTKHWKGLMSNNQQWSGSRISQPKSNRKKYRIKSKPNRWLPNRVFKLSNHCQKVFKSRFKSQSWLGFAHRCCLAQLCDYLIMSSTH